MEVECLDVAEGRLQPSATRLRRRQRRGIQEIAKSILEFGFLQPIVVDERYGVIIGNGRLAAAKHLGRKTVPVVMAKGLTEEERQRLQIADNRLAELSSWHSPELVERMEQLSKSRLPAVPGFSDEETRRLLGVTEVDDAMREFPPELEKTATPSEAHLLVSCRARDIDKMARLIETLGSESWCSLEQAWR